jgi:hypothetical protein
LVSLIFNANISVEGGNPLKIAFSVAAWQGFEKVDSVTEWPAAKVNSTVSPGAAFSVSGVNTSPFLPTATWWMVEAEAEAEAAAAVLVEVEEAAVPYWASVPESAEARSRMERQYEAMVDDSFSSLLEEA